MWLPIQQTHKYSTASGWLFCDTNCITMPKIPGKLLQSYKLFWTIFWKLNICLKMVRLREYPCELEHKTCDILAAERLRLMRFDNRLIIDSWKVVCWSKKGKTSILWHKTMRIQDILTNLGIYLAIYSRKRKFCVVLSLVKVI